MKKRQNIAKLIKQIFLLLMSIQVVLGCLWIIKNLGKIPGFGESDELIQASKDWVLDEYIGILYPLLICMSRMIEEGVGIRFCMVLYPVQLLLAFVSYAFFLKTVVFGTKEGEKRPPICLLAAYIVTFPPILQCHMSVLPYSVASSVMVLLLAFLKQLLQECEGAFGCSLLKVSICWLTGALLLPDYGYLAGITVAVGFAVLGWKHRKKIGTLLISAALVIAGIGISFSLTQSPGSLNRIQKSAGAVMLSRFTWPYFERNSYFWREEVKELFDAGELNWIALYPENVTYIFGPKLEASVGREEADKIYWEMALTSAGLGKKEALSAFGRDLAANLTGPLSMQYQLSGRGISYTGFSYECMKEYAPLLTKYFVVFSLYSFDFLLIASVFLCLWSRKKKENRKKQKFTRILLLAAVLTALWYTMIGNGMQDYRKIILIHILWCMIPAYTDVLSGETEEDV